MHDSESWQVVVVGAGMAGASVAAELAALGARVLLLEREEQPGYHTTGRSAAMFTLSYGPPVIRALSRASAPVIRGDGEGGGALPARGVVFVARDDQIAALEALAAELGPAVARLDPAACRAMVPILHAGYAAGGLIDRSAADIDVDALLRRYLRLLADHGGKLWRKAEVTAMTRERGGWHVVTSVGVLRAEIVVNAAGAWADELARLAGVAPVGLVPRRRTALLVDPPADARIDGWPMLVDVDEQFYMKPEAGKLLLSPADETPSPPCDARPEEIDIAIAIDRIQRAVALPVRRVAHEWAGLRSFVADKCPVVGPAPGAPGFFWLAGQGGYGIQTAPALARWAAAAALGLPAPGDIADQGVSASMLAPDRRALA